jgi:hypothetical protein
MRGTANETVCVGGFVLEIPYESLQIGTSDDSAIDSVDEVPRRSPNPQFPL